MCKILKDFQTYFVLFFFVFIYEILYQSEIEFRKKYIFLSHFIKNPMTNQIHCVTKYSPVITGFWTSKLSKTMYLWNRTPVNQQLQNTDKWNQTKSRADFLLPFYAFISHSPSHSQFMDGSNASKWADVRANFNILLRWFSYICGRGAKYMYTWCVCSIYVLNSSVRCGIHPIFKRCWKFVFFSIYGIHLTINFNLLLWAPFSLFSIRFDTRFAYTLCRLNFTFK